jgi:branched-subunit amino acid ABC-type transport system permease component
VIRLRDLGTGARVALGAGIVVVLAIWLGPSTLVDYAVRSLPLGCVFALMAVGIVLAYKTSGVLNLAFAAQAFVSAAVFYDLRARHEWPVPAAFAVSVLIVAPLLGVLLDRLLFRHLRSATPLARLITSIGLLVAIPEMTRIWFGRGATYNPPSVFPDPTRVYRWNDWALDGNQVGTILVTLVCVGGLIALFRFSSLGLQMRSVVESPRLSQLHGVEADRIGMSAWALSSLFAGLAGVLLAPLYAQVQAENYFTLLVAALAAAVFGRLSSIGLTFAGSLLLAATMQVLGGELPQGNIVTQNLRPALPFVVLIVLLVAWPGLAGRREVTDPLAGVDPPPPAPASTTRPAWLTRFTRVLGGVVVVGTFAAVLGGALDAYWVGRVTLAVVLAICFLSITVISGMAGTVSLCQATFAAVGAFTTAQVVNDMNTDVLTAVTVGVVVAALTGALVALPALRLRGIYLTLVTLAFAVAFETVMVPQEWVSGGTKTLRVPRPTMGPFNFDDDASYFVLCAVVLAIVGVVVVLLRGGTTGRFLDALRGSESAATSIGIDPRRTTFTAFAISAAIAGLGGGLLVVLNGQSGSGSYNANFISFLGLVWVVLVVTMGARSVQAAVTAGAAFVLMPELFERLSIDVRWATVLFGLGALTYAKHPEGILEANTLNTIRFVERLRNRPAATPAGATTGAGGGALASSSEVDP